MEIKVEEQSPHSNKSSHVLTIEEVTTQIRNFVNQSTIKRTQVFSRKHKGDWNQFCVALDTIGDTSLAIKSYLQDPGDLFVKHPYLATYGLLQALFIQQDAVKFLKSSLFGVEHTIRWNDPQYIELKKIRDVRNETIGHPGKTEQSPRKSEYSQDEVSYCTIDRSSLSSNGFGYLLWKHSGTERRHVDFSKVIEQQDIHLGKELLLVLQELKDEESKHKRKFMNDKLAATLSDSSFYQMNLIYGVRWQDHLAWPSFEHHYEKYRAVRKGLEDRYGEFGTALRIPGTGELIKKLDYVFARIDGFKRMGVFEDYEFEIYVDALIAGMNELKGHLIEVDEEFEINDEGQ